MKRSERESPASASSKAAFIDLCIELGASDGKTIIKNILRKKYSRAAGLSDSDNCDLPTNMQDLLRVDPSPSQFVDYAYLVWSMEDQISKEEIMKATLTDALELMLATTPPRKSKRQRTRKLPGKLSPFVLNEGAGDEQTLRATGAIVDGFFPNMSFVFPCVYADEQRTSFALFIPDRHVNKWKAVGSQCRFLWRTSEQDINREIFSKVIAAVPRVHVVRERSSEVVYMGTCKSVDDVNSLGTCTMFVS